MNKKRLQVKYCYTEKELNAFLKTLSITSLDCPYLHTIQYCTKPEGSSNDFETENGTHTSMHIGGQVIAIVQYFTLVEAEDNGEDE